MSHFKQAQRYVGTPYLVGQFDCADLAARVQQEIFGRRVGLPIHRERPGGARGQAREILRLRDQVADRIDVAADGCAVLLWGLNDGTPAPGLKVWHLGTAFLHAGEVWVLHNSAHLGSAALHRLADLRGWGLRLDGFYAWRSA